MENNLFGQTLEHLLEKSREELLEMMASYDMEECDLWSFGFEERSNEVETAPSFECDQMADQLILVFYEQYKIFPSVKSNLYNGNIFVRYEKDNSVLFFEIANANLEISYMLGTLTESKRVTIIDSGLVTVADIKECVFPLHSFLVSLLKEKDRLKYFM